MIKISIIKLYKKIIKNYWNQNSFILFKKPYENRIFFYSQSQENNIDKDKNLFIICSFDQKTIVKINTKEIYLSNIKNNIDYYGKLTNKISKSNFIFNDTCKYKSLLNKAYKAIENGFMKKVVISRYLKIPFHNFFLKRTFQKLIFSYPNAFISLWYDLNYGFWIGATPELLIKLDDNQLETVAIAGTIWGNKKDKKWTFKESEEHYIVVNYITNFLKKYSGFLSVEKTRVMNLGKLYHLKTPIYFSFSKKPNCYQLINQIFPTPSVCGFPKKKSFSFIQENEGFKREFYSGFFGPLCENENKIELYVNLRCARIKMDKKEIILYAGSGITKKSEIEKEYIETEKKIKSILSKFIFN
ncbi:chorismate-binding protein [Blattabacterium cuenoti]|uniref:chorismate-binding protein n=1 Tax=Blattabacterium cuenoti TaxID=1653831 RepID=UPI00163C4E16|nr:chorismate-binding protein [Blattabacterium cuenoti]